ncbi:MAG: carbohydrate binding domain-containing protein [Chthoniobacteraceae bacterium]
MNLNLCSLVILLCVHGMCACGLAENLISNPGFEEGMAPWLENNWMKNEAHFERDEKDPHSGRVSLKMDFVKAIGGASIQFLYPNLPVRPNQSFQVRYWARGVSNGPTVNLLIRKGEEPYTSVFSSESIPTEDWQEFVSTVSLPPSLDVATMQLVFRLNGPGVAWLDDVSVTELPGAEQGTPPTVNPIRNPSFEAGRDGWTATVRAREFKNPGDETGCSSPSPEGALLETIESADAPHGRRYLSLNINPRSFATLTSAYFPGRYGHPMRLKFSLKSDGARGFQTALISGKNGNTRKDSEASLKASAHWQTFSVPVKLRPALGGMYSVSFNFYQPGRYDLDAVSLVEEENPDAALFPVSVAIEPEPDAPVAQLYEVNQSARFRLRIAGRTGAVSPSYGISVDDYLGREINRQTVKVALDGLGYGDAFFSVPTKQYGSFRLVARSADGSGNDLLAEQIYSVLPSLPPPAARPDSFFGGHVDLTSYNLEIARKAGFRWLRLYPPLATQWMVVEPAQGEWNFQTEEVAQAKNLGFKILGNLGIAPLFAADLDPKDSKKPRWCTSYPPADIGQWKEYVTRCFNAFYPHIDAWEIWNEPDGGYLQVRPGVNKANVYYSLLESANEALTATQKPFFLLGPGVANINAPLGWEVLEKGGSRWMDAFSFHFYSLAAGGNNPDTEYAARLLSKYATYRNRDGRSLPLWHSEGGIYLQGSQSWLETYRIPPSSSVTPSQGAASMVRSALFFKASGVKRYFDYQAAASPAGRNVSQDITCGFIDVTGIPGPGIAAHAAMVALVEDAAPAGFETQIVDGVPVKIARFKVAKGHIDVYWAGAAIALSKVIPPAANLEARDLMGNIVPMADAQLGEYPVYVCDRSSVQKYAGKRSTSSP